MPRGNFQPNTDTINTSGLVAQVSKGVEGDVAKFMRKWARNLEKNTKRQSEIKRINEETATAARTAVQKAYATSGIGKRPSYRQNDRGKLKRYAGEQMKAALDDPKIIRADSRGIYFIDKKRLDKKASQWYRLNFGASPKGRKKAITTPMKFFGKSSTKRFNLDRYQPSDPFLVPRGFFSQSFYSSSSPGKNFKPGTKKPNDAFYLRNKTTRHASRNPNFVLRQYYKDDKGNKVKENGKLKPVMSKGIKGHSFLDRGAQAINIEYPKKITKTFKDWEKLARKSSKR